MEFQIRNGVLERCTGSPYETSCKVPETVTAVGDGAFRDFAFLKEIILPEHLVSIGTEAFRNCASLQKISVPASVRVIGGLAFKGCTSLTDITLPEGLTQIRAGLFADCAVLKKIKIPDTVTKIWGLAFSGCRSLESLILSDSITQIGESAFKNCENLKQIRLPEKITELPSFMLYNCSSLWQIHIPESVKIIRRYVFSGCHSLTEIIIPEAIEFLSSAFVDNCKNLRRVLLPDTIRLLRENIDGLYTCKAVKIYYHGLCLSPEDVPLNHLIWAVRDRNFLPAVYEKSWYRTEPDPVPGNLAAAAVWYKNPKDKALIRHIRQHMTEIFTLLIRTEQTEIIRSMIQSQKFLTAINIDSFIRCAIENQKIEIQLLLTNYKAERIGYQSIEKTIQEKFQL